MTKVEDKLVVRFFRSQLETIVWDKERNRILADFNDEENNNSPRGTFTTNDERTIKILRQLRYPEIPLDMKAPPDNVVVVQAPAPPRRTNELADKMKEPAPLAPGVGLTADGQPAVIGGGKVPIVRVKPGE